MKKLLLVLFLSINLFAQQPDELVESKLISEVTAIQPGNPFWIGLNLKMEDGWHTYWENAGDAGMATYINWNLPEGFKASKIYWQYPKKIYMSGLANFGYEGETTLLIQITPPKEIIEKSITLKAHAEWLVCKVECLPGNADLEITLPVSNELQNINQANLEIFANARFNLPLENSEWQIESVKNKTDVILKIRAAEINNYDLGNLYFYPSVNGIYKNAPDQKLEKKSDAYYLTVKLEEIRIDEPNKLSGVLVASNGWRGGNSEKALSIDIPFSENFDSNEEEQISIIAAILFAFIGGLILNLMPCVLPVLSIKIMSFVKHKKQTRKESFTNGLWFSFGVLVSFWILIALLLILREGGEALGWGFQLQSPIFIFLISIFMFLFALNLFGVFEFGSSLNSIESKINSSNENFSNFLTGITATIVATPCTAPFMGTALGFALTQSAFVNFLIFTSLGLGMAFPFLLLTAFPNWMKIIPKPGEWMIKLKQFMGFLLAATVIWLIWVFGIQKGSDSVVILLISILISSIAAWIYGNWGMIYVKPLKRYFAQIISLLLIVFSIYFGITNTIETTSNYEANTKSSLIDWKKFNPKEIDKLLNEGKPLFIDFTAAWCLSCQVNERVVLNTEEVSGKFKELGVATFKADWTNKSEEITNALAEYGRNSVPLYILYDGKNKQPQKLPEILTKSIVLDALKNITN